MLPIQSTKNPNEVNYRGIPLSLGLSLCASCAREDSLPNLESSGEYRDGRRRLYAALPSGRCR